MPTPKPQLLLLTTIIINLITLQFQIQTTISQQQYINNLQFNCSNNDNRTLGFTCNGARSTCPAYLTFRSNPPDYATPETIATLLGANSSDVAHLNGISESQPIPAGHVVVVPINCTCNSNRYYQHNSSYRLRETGETYQTMANNTYQGLTTCQAMIRQNPSDQPLNLHVGDEFRVPLRCACPTVEQERRYGTRFLLYYGVTPGDDVSLIAEMFGVDIPSVLDANELNVDSTIYYFSPILVPLRSVPTNVNFSSPSLVVPNAPQSNPLPNPVGSGGSSKKWVFVGIGIGAGVLVLFLSSIFVWFFFLRPSKNSASIVSNKKKGTKNDPESVEYATVPGSYSSSQNPKLWSGANFDGFVGAIESLTAYKFSELEKATGKFSEANRIKGSVFEGEFNGDEAAIKILKGRVASDEINLLKQINHANIIRLSGYCFHEGNTYLVYEFAEKGSLDTWLFRHQNEENSVSRPVLGWKERVQIAFDVAEAINYLHSYVNPPYIHKNLKSSNVVLDASYRAKITNFGLARTLENTDETGEFHLTKHVIGTHGYLAPEYIENGLVTPKMDVFAFGVVVLELLSGKPAVMSSEKNRSSDDLLFGVIGKVFEGGNVREELMGFMDTNLGRKYPLDLAYSIAQLAYKCVDRDLNSRPSMSEVSMMLSKIHSSSMDWDPLDE